MDLAYVDTALRLTCVSTTGLFMECDVEPGGWQQVPLIEGTSPERVGLAIRMTGLDTGLTYCYQRNLFKGFLLLGEDMGMSLFRDEKRPIRILTWRFPLQFAGSLLPK